MIVLMLSLCSVVSSLLFFHNIGLIKNNSALRVLVAMAVVDESLWFGASLCSAVMATFSLFAEYSSEPTFDQFVSMVGNVITVPNYWMPLSSDASFSWIVTGCILFRLFWRFYFVVKAYLMARAVMPILCFVFFTYMPFPLLMHCFWGGWE